jgi:hypothetical protein
LTETVAHVDELRREVDADAGRKFVNVLRGVRNVLPELGRGREVFFGEHLIPSENAQADPSSGLPLRRFSLDRDSLREGAGGASPDGPC